MKEVNLVFPHQLCEKGPFVESRHPVYLVEEELYFNQYAFHKQKLAFHRASMKKYAAFLERKGRKVIYINARTATSDIRELIPELKKKGIEKINYMDVSDDWLAKRIEKTATKSGIKIQTYENQLFLNTADELLAFFTKQNKKLSQSKFYIQQRKIRNILLDKQKKPIGGKWSFDPENRKKYPKTKKPPEINFPTRDEFYREAKNYVAENFADNPGELSNYPIYPTDFKGAKQWLNDFLKNRFKEFGSYEDAIVAEERFINHSVLSPLLNTGLLSPEYVLDKVIQYAEEKEIPLNSTEGFIRQLIGWREFIRGIYRHHGVEERNKNFWGFTKPIPGSFYTGKTGILPVDKTIQKVLETGYCHHIERLMVLGNFMLLCEFDPKEVYRWFMEMFIDSYDWVMVPNVYGMSQFADGGFFASKPYLSGSNYLKKMSDFPKGKWEDVWDGLFWRFMHNHRDFFSGNPRLSMLLRTFDRMKKDKQNALLKTAEEYLDNLS